MIEAGRYLRQGILLPWDC